MFILNGKPLSPDVAFTHNGIQYPANWLRLSTLQEKRAIGITEVPDPDQTYDQRFYWGVGLPKDQQQLVDQWVSQTRTTAGSLLVPSDWQVIREADNGTPVPVVIKEWRESIRTACSEKIIHIGTCVDVDDLASYITGSDYPVWPTQPLG